jgi:hypothetical protein
MDQHQLVATDEDLADFGGGPLGQALDQDVDEEILVVVVEHVGEPVCLHPDHARQDAVLSVRHELDLLGGPCNLAGLLVGRLGGRGLTAEDDAKATSETLDHWCIVRAVMPAA